MEAQLPGDYIAGFVDGEGCFALKFRRDIKHSRKGTPIYFWWDIEFAILLKQTDAEILQKIQDTLDCGKISLNKQGAVRYSVNSLQDLIEKIVPFFEKHPLYAQKRFDFELWKEAVGIFSRNQRTVINVQLGKRGFQRTIWNTDDLERLKIIHQEMNMHKGGNRGNWKWAGSFKSA